MSAGPTIDAHDPSLEKRTEGRAVRPALAASLVLVKGEGAAARVLLGRRAGAHKFMPGKFVCPGGRVDRADAYGPVDAPPPTATRTVLEARLTPGRARAAPLAAIRETLEETGVLAGRPSSAAADARPPWRAFADHGLAPAVSALALIARAITPPMLPRRFDAWFFLARAEELETPRVAPATAELEEVDWYPLVEAHDLDLPSIQRFVLAETLTRLAEPGVERRAPFVRMVRGRERVEPL